MIIRGNVLTIHPQRTDYAQTDPREASFLVNNPREAMDEALRSARETAEAALPRSGGTMTGDLLLGGNRLTGLTEPEQYTDAATKGYVDGRRRVLHAQLTAGGWTGDGPYTQTLPLEGILETDTPHYGVVYSQDPETALGEKENWALVDDLDTAEGTVTFTCFQEKPTLALTVQMEVNR